MEKLLLNNKYFITSDFKIEINSISKIAAHTHDFIEFVYMLKGKSVHIVDGDKYPMNSGDLLIINYNQSHSFNGDPDAKFCNILVKPSFIDKRMHKNTDLFALFETSNYKEFKEFIDNKCNFIRFSPEEKNCFEYMLLLLNKELNDKEIGYTVTSKAGMNFLLTMIFRKMCKSLSYDDTDFKEILKYIEKNYMDSISLNDLSKICHYNPSYFSRVFKKYSGVTFTEYLKRIRITNACLLIDKGDIPISDIYVRVGYTNKTNFYKHFKEIIGLTPLNYKKAKE